MSKAPSDFVARWKFSMELAAHDGISAAALRIALHLIDQSFPDRHAPGWRTSSLTNERLCEITNLNSSTVSRAVTQLIDAALFVKRSEGRTGRARVLAFKPAIDAGDEAAEPEQPAPAVEPEAAPVEKVEKPAPAPRDAFAEIWALWNRKEWRHSAVKAFDAVIASGAASPDSLIASAAAYAAAELEKGVQPDRRKSLHKWLSEELWRDAAEPLAPAAAVKPVAGYDPDEDDDYFSKMAVLREAAEEGRPRVRGVPGGEFALGDYVTVYHGGQRRLGLITELTRGKDAKAATGLRVGLLSKAGDGLALDGVVYCFEDETYGIAGYSGAATTLGGCAAMNAVRASADVERAGYEMILRADLSVSLDEYREVVEAKLEAEIARQESAEKRERDAD